MKIGVISDTHGLIRKSVLKNLKGVDLIIHAGDIGKQEIINALKQIAPVLAVRGNTDKGEWAEAFPVINKLKINTINVLIVHNIEDLKVEEMGKRVLVYGHSHQPYFEQKGELFYLNPGSAGPRRFNLPISMAYLWIKGQEIKTQHIFLAE